MRHLPQRSVISVVADYCRRWLASDSRMSREAVADSVVNTYYRMQFDRVVGIDFRRAGQNPTRALKTNAERFWRWLNDVDKCNTLLPPNLLPVVLGAMPLELRAACAQELLAPCGLSVGIHGSAMSNENLHVLLRQMLKEGGEANVAFASLLDRHGDDRNSLLEARSELVEARAAFDAAIDRIDAQLEMTR